MDELQEANERYYKALTRRIIFIVVIVSIIPLVLISGTIRYFFQASYQEKVLEHLKVLLKKHRQNIDNFLTEKLANIRALTESYTIEQLTNESFLKDRLRVLQDSYGRSFTDLGVVNDKGIQVAYAGPFRLTEADYSQAAWFKNAMEKDIYISDVFPGLRGLPHFIVTVRQEYQGRKWLLRATVDFDSFNSLVENLRVGSTGFAFIFNSAGELQTRPQSEINPSAEPYSTFIKSCDKHPETMCVFEKTDGPENMLYVMTRLKNGDWILAFQQTEKDAYAALYTARFITMVIFLGGLIGIIIVAVLVARGVVSRIRSADKEKEMLNDRVIEAGKLASIGELAAGIAHEINNPVAVMVEEAGWIQDLLEEDDLKESTNAEEFRRSLQQIRLQGSRCKEITHKLLSFARKTDPRPTDVKINSLVEDVVVLCHQRARYATVKIETDLDPNLPEIHVSPTEMQQVLMNLINNAVDAIDTGGGTVRVKTLTRDSKLIIEVADDGPGIPESNLQRIFDPFFTTKPVGKGTGLGLSICYGIITKMGGQISVSSSVDVGTTFRVLLPLNTALSSKREMMG